MKKQNKKFKETKITKGSGYSRANVTITGTGGSNATAVPRISPPQGHGADPVDILFSAN